MSSDEFRQHLDELCFHVRQVALAVVFCDVAAFGATFALAWGLAAWMEHEAAALLFKHACAGLLVAMAVIVWRGSRKGGSNG